MATTDEGPTHLLDDHAFSLMKESSDKMENLEDEGIVLSHKESPEPRIFSEEDGKDVSKPSLETDEVLGSEKNAVDIIGEVEEEDLMDRIKRNQKMVIDSDEEEIFTPFARSHKNAFLDSDSEDEKRKSLSGRRKIHRIGSDDDDDDSDNENSTAVQQISVNGTAGEETQETPLAPYKYNKDIFDTETSDEEGDRSQRWEEPNEISDSGHAVKKKKNKLPSMKERQQELKDIHSDAQRMVRESAISLPYHRAKQRTLADFLSRKKAIPKLTQVKGSLKRSMKSMDTVKELEQRKQDAEDFYKSASEDEDVDDKEWKPDDEKKDQCNSDSENEEMFTLNPKEEETLPSLMENDESGNQPGSCLGNSIPEADNLTVNDPSASEGRIDSNENHDKITTDQASDNSDPVGEDGQESNRNLTNDSGVISGCSSAAEDNHPEEEDESPSEEGKDGLVMGSEKMGRDVENQNLGKDLGSQGEVQSLENDQDQATAELPVEGASVTPKISLLAKKMPGLDVSKIAMTTPKLSTGDKEDFIDLDDESVGKTTPNQSGVLEFMNRFFKHSTTKKKPAEKQNVTLSIVSKEKGEDGNEKLVTSSVNFCTNAEENEVGEQVPGAAHRALRSTLQARIREQREKDRQRREKEKRFMESEEVAQDYLDDLPNEEEEMEDVEETDVETESEPEENDVIIRDKKKKKSRFVDEEAEEDDEFEDEEGGDEDLLDDGDGDAEGDEDESDAEMEKIKENIKSIIDNDDSNGAAEMNTEKEDDGGDENDLHLCLEETQDLPVFKKTPLSRKPTEDIFATQPEERALNKSGSAQLERDTSINSIDSSFELFGSVIPGHQPGGGMKNERRSSSSLPFMTPSLKDRSINSEKEEELELPELREGSSQSHIGFPTPRSNLHLTPLADSQFPQIKEAEIPKLKLDFSGVAESQSEDDLIGLCSGTFSDVKDKGSVDNIAQLCSESGVNHTQDIGEMVGLCSGQFTNSENVEEEKFPRLLGSASDEPDTELLGLCTGRFTQSAGRQDSTDTVLLEAESCNARDASDTENNIKQQKHPVVVESSDEEGSSRKMVEEQRKTKRKRKRIVLLSDDEDGLDDGYGMDDGDSMSSPMFDDDENSLGPVEYDEDENEIPRFKGFKDTKKGGIRADFIEKEAELSGSEEESEDEEEPDEDNDFMEMEEGDHDRFDQENLRDQVGRAHLKTLLDSDQRQLRLLQELYLEDGDLHGQGRQRKFRWSGVDKDDDQVRTVSDNEHSDEEEAPEDAEWRKQRHEREKFLLEMRKKEEVSTNEFKLDKVPLLRSVSYTGPKKEPLKPNNDQPPPTVASVGLNPFSLKKKRGSFLTRGKDSLAKLAELVKDKGNTTIGGAKQSGNFVFRHLSSQEVEERKEKQKKLAARSSSDLNVKRPRVERSFFSMDETTRSSSIFKHF